MSGWLLTRLAALTRPAAFGVRTFLGGHDVSMGIVTLASCTARAGRCPERMSDEFATKHSLFVCWRSLVDRWSRWALTPQLLALLSRVAAPSG